MRVLISLVLFVGVSAGACCDVQPIDARVYLSDFVEHDSIRVPAGCWATTYPSRCFEDSRQNFLTVVNAYIKSNDTFRNCLAGESVSTELTTENINDEAVVAAIKACYE